MTEPSTESSTEPSTRQPSEIQTKFHGKAQAYDRARPGYPDAAMQHIASLLPDGARIADIGAGTGKFTVPLARLGYEIAAVEPDADMRGVLADAVRPYPNVTVADGTAERTGLRDRSVDAITCAQALHWFDHDAFLAECARVSRGESFLLISIYNSTSFDSAMMRGVDRDVPGVSSGGGNTTGPADSANASQAVGATAVSDGDAADIGVSARHFRETAAAFFTHPTIRRFPNPIRYTHASWRAYMDSHSHSPLPTDPAYPAHRAWVDAIFDARSVDGILTDDNVTMIASERIHVR
ncbi:class I SAM-dependent methyltransferase [Bifidobacterium simiiventris]|uniref:class I SAM-dependent methyltransferase n=1 Tax=Bifidobacterium simiiventris TaxID=2834434 RepID=UPI001C599F30|nr:class I SAM-dependent methyltransferase [Bifidobacterium simiiventris]